MEAENKKREHVGYSLAYDEAAFAKVQDVMIEKIRGLLG